MAQCSFLGDDTSSGSCSDRSAEGCKAWTAARRQVPLLPLLACFLAAVAPSAAAAGAAAKQRRALLGLSRRGAGFAAPAPGPVAAPRPAPAPAPGPALPPRPELTALTSATCSKLVGALAASGCQFYDFGSEELGVGCTCSFASAAGCPPAADAEGLGLTGAPIAMAPLAVPEMLGEVRVTCFYRQWLWDQNAPTAAVRHWQQETAAARTVDYMSSASLRAEMNSVVAAAPLWALTPRPFLQQHPDALPPGLLWPLPAPAPAPGPVSAPMPGPGPAPIPAPGSAVLR